MLTIRVLAGMALFAERAASRVWSMTRRLGVEHLERGFPFNSPLRRETAESRLARRG